jgi:hypothetical protein
MMYKIRGDGPGVHFNIGLSDADKVELDAISLETLLATHVSAFTSGASLYRGVCWKKREQKWQARISHCGIDMSLGHYHFEEDAARAYDSAAKEMHGQYALIYFIMLLFGHEVFKCYRLSIPVCILSD